MQPPFLCFRADSGNFLVLVGQAVIFLPGSGAERTSRKAVEARRCWSVGLRARGAAQGGDPHHGIVSPWGTGLGIPRCPMPPVPGTADPAPEPCQAAGPPASPSASLSSDTYLPAGRWLGKQELPQEAQKVYFRYTMKEKLAVFFSSVRRNFLEKRFCCLLKCWPVSL